MFIIKSMLYRLMQMIVVLFVISTLTFILMKLSPGNPVDKILHLDVAQVSTEQINATKDKLGLNDSLLVQWWHWMNHLLHFNLGKSFESKEPVTQILFNYAPITLLISFSTLVVSLCISIPLGIIAAKRFHKWTDKVIRVISTLSISLPAFFIGIILLFIVTNLMNIDSVILSQFILPVITLSLGMCAYIIRLVRSNLLMLLQSNIVQASRLRGMNERYISQNYAESFNDHTKLGKQLTAIYRKHYKGSKEEALSKVDKALSWVNLQSKDILNKYSFQLSGGQLERVYIASVLMLEPKLIIADEPVASLDALNGNQVMDLLQHIVLEHGQTLFIITHNLSHVLKYCQYIYVLKEGQIIERGNINHFKYEHLHPYTERLIKYRTQLKRDYYD